MTSGNSRGSTPLSTSTGPQWSRWKASSSSAYTTDKLKWSTHTASVVKKAQQRLFNLRRLNKNPHKLLQMHNSPATAGLSRGWCGLPNASPGANYMPSRIPTAPDVTGRPKRSLKTTTTRATACSPHNHPESEVSTGASKLGQRD